MQSSKPSLAWSKAYMLCTVTPNEQRLREVLLKLEAVRNQLDLIATTAATQSVALERKNGAHSSDVAKVIRRHIADAPLTQVWTLDAPAPFL